MLMVTTVNSVLSMPMPDNEVTIDGFHQDEEGYWVAELSCGHTRHMRHQPPWQIRPWVMDQTTREQRVGQLLSCKECQQQAK